jgi:hypothetical protein
MSGVESLMSMGDSDLFSLPVEDMDMTVDSLVEMIEVLGSTRTLTGTPVIIQRQVSFV